MRQKANSFLPLDRRTTQYKKKTQLGKFPPRSPAGPLSVTWLYEHTDRQTDWSEAPICSIGWGLTARGVLSRFRRTSSKSSSQSECCETGGRCVAAGLKHKHQNSDWGAGGATCRLKRGQKKVKLICFFKLIQSLVYFDLIYKSKKSVAVLPVESQPRWENEPIFCCKCYDFCKVWLTITEINFIEAQIFKWIKISEVIESLNVQKLILKYHFPTLK